MLSACSSSFRQRVGLREKGMSALDGANPLKLIRLKNRMPAAGLVQRHQGCRIAGRRRHRRDDGDTVLDLSTPNPWGAQARFHGTQLRPAIGGSHAHARRPA